ncbi:MAG: helix-turn-helix domain-containing protein [Promethearchaeota archaeon]
MKRVLLQMSRDFVNKSGYKFAMNFIDNLEIVKILSFNNYYITTLECIRFKDYSHTPKDILGLSGIQYIAPLKRNSKLNEYLCIVKTHSPRGFSKYFKNYEILVDTPILINKDDIIIPYISLRNNIDKVCEKIKKVMGNDYEILNISKFSMTEDDIYSLLTGRQLEIAIQATRKGYFDIPRRITAKELAKEFNISKSALTEHIRKVKKIIFHAIFQ